MKEKTSLVFTGDIGFDRYFYGKWDDEELISEEILDFLNSADHVIPNVEGPIANAEQNTTQSGVQQLLHTIDPKAVKVLKKMGADIWYEIAFDKVGTKNLMATYAKLTKA